MPTLDIAIDALKAKYGADQFDSAVRKMQRGAISLDGDINKTEKKVLGLGGAFGGLASRLTGLAAVYAGVRFFKSSIQEMAKFEMELANIATMLDKQTMSYLPKYKEELSRLAIKYGESTSVLSKGLYDIISAAIDASKAVDVLNASAIAAIAGLSQTGIAADVLTTIINSYGMSADRAMRISDVLFATIVRGKTTFDELAATLGQVLSFAATAGLSFEELTAALATMTRAGISTDIAVTSLRGILTTFLSPTKENIEAAKKLGLELNTNTLRTIGLTGAVKLLQNATAEQVAEVFSNVRALSGLAALIQQVDGFMYDLTQTTDSAGKTLEAYGKVADATSIKMRQFNESWKAFKRTAGEEFKPALTPILEGLINIMPDVAGSFQTVVHGGENIAAVFAASAGSIGKLTSKVLYAIPGMYDIAVSAEKASIQFKKWSDAAIGIDNRLKSLSTTTADFNKEWTDFIDQMTTLGIDWRTLDRLDKNLANSIKLMEKKGQITDEATLKFLEDQKKEAIVVEEATERVQQLIRELQLEREILFLTDEERERAIKLAELEAIAKGKLTGGSAKLIEQYKEELKKLQDMKELEKLVTTVTDSVGNLVEAPLTAILDSTRSFGDVIKDELRNLGRDILTMMYKEMITAPIKKWATTALTDIFVGGAEKGIVMSRAGQLEHFGLGGVVNRPTLFPMANGMGLMAEKEPEAVMPLARDKSGRLGVRTEGSRNETSLKIINVLDKSIFQDYLSSGAGERVIVNIMRRNQDQIGGVS